MSSYLHPDPETPLYGVNALKLWLKGDITTSDFLSSENGGYADKGGRDTFSLQELHRALYIAILEISLKLDPELECSATLAGGNKYSIAVDVDDFYEGRDSELRSMVDLDPEKRSQIISTYDREAVCEVLEQAREEIGWLESQARRLEVHMEVAQEMKRARSRSSFMFRPLERSWLVDNDADDLEVPDRSAVEADAESMEMEEAQQSVEGEEEEEVKQEGVDATEEGTPERAESIKDEIVEQEKRLRKQRLELFKKEVDIGFEIAKVENGLEEGELQDKNDSPVVGSGVKKGKGKSKGKR